MLTQRLSRSSSRILFHLSSLHQSKQTLHTTNTDHADKSYKLVIVGGGTGGCSIAAKYASKLGKGAVAVIEPNDTHYYQPMWTLVGGGLKPFSDTHRPESDVLPKGCDWIKDRAVTFNPDACTVTTANNDKVKYEYLVVAMGLQINYDKIPGLQEALASDNRVCSNYSPIYVNRTLPAIDAFKGGNAIFTFPNTPIKCAGAPQKIMYLAEHRWRQAGIRDKSKVMFNSALGAIFAVPQYAESLLKVIKERNIDLNFKHSLTEVKPNTGEAIFENLDQPGKSEKFKYDFLHVTPPMGPPATLKSSPLSDQVGWLDVNKETLQHTKYPNVFGIGDCTNVPTSKTAAAVAGQNGILRKNLDAVMGGQQPQSQYNGYTSCPLVIGGNQCILAEFDFNLKPLETFPINQAKPSRMMYYLKSQAMPSLYWSLFLKGHWNGPATVRKLLRLGM